MEALAARQRIVLVLGVLLAFPLSCFGDSVRTYGGQYDLRIPAKPADPTKPDTRGWMDDAVIDVPDHFDVCDVDVRISITHTHVFDLCIFLQSPAGARICLVMYNPYLNEYFEGENYTQTVFDDEAEIAIDQGEPPFTGRFRPRDPYRLAAFDGEDCFGLWRLQIYDAFYMDTGNLSSLELILTVIEPATLSLLRPNGGEVLTAGSTCTISWACTGPVGDVLLEYSIDNGATWTLVNVSDTSQASSYDWQVPAVDSNQCLVRVSDVNDPNISGTSNAVFTIQPAMVTVPDVVGMAHADAASAIISAGLVVGVITQQHSDIVPAGHVLSQNPAPAAPALANSAVDLVLSCGPPALVVPPTVVTLAATEIGRTTATLRGLVLDDGGEPCQYRFTCWTWGFWCCTGWSDPADCKTTGQLFFEQETGLTAATYYFMAQAKNSAGESNWADLQTFTVRAFTGSGSGTKNDPYIIRNVYELQQIDRDLAACYELGNDIDASDTKTWNSGYGFTPIGRYAAPFEGIFDGKGHVITGLNINRHCLCVGLFGCANGQSQIRNLGLSDVTVTGYTCVGGLTGFNAGAIEACYVSGSVNGTEQVGGLVGTNNGLVTDSYSATEVFGPQQESYIGGLVGVNRSGALKNCYSAGKVGGENSGGLAGTCSGECAGCFWDIETSGRATSACGMGRTTAEMQTWATFDAADWSAKGRWTICEGMDYPKLAWQIRPGDKFCPDGVDMLDFAVFAAQWRAGSRRVVNHQGDSADIDRSGVVDGRDLEILTSGWLTSGR